MAGKKNKVKKGNSSERDRVLEDPRFEHVKRDPRFRRMPQSERKFTVDDRFKAMFSNPEFQSEVQVDKYGRRVEDHSSAKEIKKFYRLEEEEESQKEDSPPIVDLKGKEEAVDGNIISSDSEDMQESSEDDIDNLEMYANEVDDGENVMEEEVPVGDETNRLAVVNLSWDKIRAVDVFVMLSSFLPEGGILKTVTVYYSDFGLQKIEEESSLGPQGIWKDEQNGSQENLQDVSDNEEEAFDQEKLRQYELQRLKYFYAIAEFDSVGTASHIYRECDNMEFQGSGNVLDLRFVPDDQSFGERRIRESANQIPLNYEAPDFYNKALQHTKVDLSWDADDFHRQNLFQRRITKEDVREAEFQEYLASDGDSDAYGSDAVVNISGEEDEDGESVVLKRRARSKFSGLLASIQGIGSDGEGEHVEEEKGLDIVFESGLRSVGKEILHRKKEKNLRDNETVFETQQRKLKEKKKLRREKNKAKLGDEEHDDAEAVHVVNDPFFQGAFDDDDYHPAEEFQDSNSAEKSSKKSPQLKKKNKKSNEEVEKDKKERADLELLMMNDSRELVNDNKSGYDLKELVERNLVAKGLKKQKKRKKGDMEDVEDIRHDSFKVDLVDPRFQAVFDHPEFALDPTNPAYKPTAGMDELQAERQRRRLEIRNLQEQSLKEKKSKKINEKLDHTSQQTSDGSSIGALVQRLKRRAIANK